MVLGFNNHHKGQSTPSSPSTASSITNGKSHGSHTSLEHPTSKMSGKQPWYLPIEHPAPSSSLPPARAPLTKTEQSTYDSLLAYLSAPDLVLPRTLKGLKDLTRAQRRASGLNQLDNNARPAITRGDSYQSYASSMRTSDSLAALTDKEKCYLSKESLERICRSVRWDLNKATARAEETIVWRREYGVEELSDKEIEEEALTGKELLLGYDIHSRPVLYMYPGRQNTKTGPRQIKFVVWCLERAVDLMPPGVDSLCLNIDFGSGHGGGQPTSLGQAREVLNILQNYYCERLGRACCVRVPLVFWGFYKLVGPFIDPMTKDKIRFNPKTTDLIPAEQLDKSTFGGALDFQYNHDTYFPALVKLAAERRQAQYDRWREYGDGKPGLSEWIIKGGEEAHGPEAGHQHRRASKDQGHAVQGDSPVDASPSASLRREHAAGGLASAESSAPSSRTHSQANSPMSDKKHFFASADMHGTDNLSSRLTELRAV
ncbi:uncharacterized protein L969DRAFT_84683 [Mixia osmundae IAM 14324]|uniref:CRAL-TRIO domain-containing protein n=1 Tax=Mixia osmundae (strain CBS 9802 / IAM 14324 / JCM 22182 / KY 12970) TaxID=764103 RepID=G7DTM0_MIXOS|nr:uncharacterized protein L969DRAFT_84683 [Mixia osmundae IAM 14324]KEI42796.1 hypothetical protein L969DRAFT_84683 [Mixia osmundae IAM 14324]GAA93867.1 hypothetical protein E5Q_00513 [Mixia osmundae IAM 14324]